MKNTKNESKPYLAIIKRTFDIIEYIFKNHNMATFSSMQKDLSIPKASLFRILSTLESEGMIVKNNRDIYSLGFKFVYYGEKVKSNMGLIDIAKPHLENLAQVIGETVNLNIPYNNSVLNIFSVEGERSILSSKLLPIAPLNCSSCGKLILAYSDKKYLKNYFTSHTIEKRTCYSVDNYEDFKSIKEKIIYENLAIDDEEYEYGLYCISMPIFNNKQQLFAAISISAPKARIANKNMAQIKQLLRDTTHIINQKIQGGNVSQY